MTLGNGSALGVYEIVSPLGSGGMGEVYRARDTRLGREVAIKVLPAAVEREPERIARFEREARVLASLNHPHIAALYGMERSGDRHFLIMELVEGETLADRLRRGPIPVEEALQIAIQIAEALEAAHEKGIIHRDLKPANIKISPDDKVKVLDFGLAKAMEPDARPGADATHSPTLSLMATQAGMILGTAAYMSPEQAKGLTADHRSDVFSFGNVLYEMLTGRQPFQGDTVPDILASVLAREPDLAALPANLNPRLTDLLQRCLDKHPKRRWQAVGDLRAELEAIAASPRSAPTTAPLIVPSKPLWRHLAPMAAIAVVFTVVGALGVWNLRTAPRSLAPIVRFSLIPPDGVSTMRSQVLAISPDGTHVAYASNGQLFLHSMADGNDRPIVGTNLDAMAPFFSPDGQWVGFFSFNDSTLKKIAVTGGIAVTICKTEPPSGVYWSGDQILYAHSTLGILRVSANGGMPQVIIPSKPPEAFAVPQVLNGGKDVLFSHATETGPDRWDKARVVVHSLESGTQKVVFEGGSGARYVPSGHLVYLVGGTLFALPFDLATWRSKADPCLSSTKFAELEPPASERERPTMPSRTTARSCTTSARHKSEGWNPAGSGWSPSIAADRLSHSTCPRNRTITRASRRTAAGWRLAPTMDERRTSGFTS